MRRENQNRGAYLSTLPYATDQGVRNKAGRITLPAMLADTTDAKRRWAEANEIEVPEGFRGLPMRFETEQQAARSAEPGERLTQSSLTENTKKVQTQRGVTIRLHKYTDLSQLSNTERDALKLAQAVKMLGVTNVEAHDTLSANGMYDPTTNTVHFALDAENPIAALSHELAHYIEYHAGEKYGEFVEFLQQQANAARRNGWDTLVQEKLEQYADATRSETDMRALAESEAIAEMCEDLLRSETRFREFIQRDRTLGERIVDFFDDILRNLRQLIPTRSARGASTMIRDVEKARDYYWSLLEEAKGQETEASKKVEPRFAIRSFVDEKGKTKYYVKADGSRVLHGRDPAKWAIQIENYIQNLVNDEGTIDIRSADGSVLTITGYGTRALKTTAGELSNFSDYYDAYGNLMPEARARAEASLYVDEVAQVSKDAGDVIKTDKGAEHEDLAINGWKYRDVFFEDVDGKYYQITLSVPQGIEGKQVAYGIGNIRNRKSPINPGSSLSGAPKDGTLSAISIRDGAEKSNPQFENSKKIRESIRRTFPEREARPALDRAREILGSTQERYEDGRKIPTGKEVAQLLAGGLHANRSWGLKDVVRNIDAFAGKNTEVRNRLEEMIERPFNEAGGAYARNLKARTTAFVETMKALDIRTEQDSAAVQRWGEGVRQNQYGELVEYTLADLQRECPDNWRNVQRAAEVCRGIYEGYVDELNAMLEQIYPNVIEHAETDTKSVLPKQDA